MDVNVKTKRMPSKKKIIVVMLLLALVAAVTIVLIMINSEPTEGFRGVLV